MAENVTLEFLGAQMERIDDDVNALRDDIKVLTTIVLRHDKTMTDMVTRMRATVSQHSRFNDRLRRLEEQSAG
jgi:hypothetical protein